MLHLASTYTNGRAAQFSTVRRTRSRRRASTAASLNNPSVASATVESPSTVFNAPASSSGKQKTAIVIGAGVGGLGVAGRLAKEGYSVTVLEKNGIVGGRLQSVTVPEAPGHTFDTGPSLLLFPNTYKECFRALGSSLDEHVDIVRVDPAYRVHFGDNTTFDLVYDVQLLSERIEALEKGAGKRFFEWLRNAKLSLDLGVKAFIEQDCPNALVFLDPKRILEVFVKVGPFEILGQHDLAMKCYFQNPKLRALFTMQELYVGLSPYTGPAVFSLLAGTELTDGVWYPKGGFQMVRDGLEAMAKRNGADIRLNSPVQRILLEPAAEPAEGSSGSDRTVGRAVGVELASGEKLFADVVVANPDIPYAYDKLLPDGGEPIAKEAERIAKWDYSASVITLYWALNGELKNTLHHTVFLSSDMEGAWNRPVWPEDFKGQRNFYVHNPAISDPSCAPAGCQSVMIMLPVANLQEVEAAAQREGRPMPDYKDLIQAGREMVARRFKEAGVADDVLGMISHEFVITPPEWVQRYNLKHGAVFGLSHGVFQLACFRPPVQSGLPGWPDSPKVENLYFVGASTRPGNGVPLVMMGVNTTVENILKDGAATPAAGQGAQAQASA